MKSLMSFALIGLSIFPTLAISALYSLTWGNCSSPGIAASDPPGLSCGTMQVPLNWDNPHQGNISLGIIRFKSAETSSRVGNLFLNFGGPGGSSVKYISKSALGTRSYFSPNLLKHFDLIGLDPRGVGISSPIRCDPALWNQKHTWFPSTEAEFEKMVARNKAIGQSCLNLTGPLLGHIDTISAARDMEALRLALNEGKMNFFGFSYGSQLGTQYAELHPNSFRTLAIDGNLDHSQTETNMVSAEDATAQDVFKQFVAWCSTWVSLQWFWDWSLTDGRTSTCALYGKDIIAEWEKLLVEAAAKPIPALGCIDPAAGCHLNVTAEDILFQLQPWLVSQFKPPTNTTSYFNWPTLAEAIVESLAGNATLFSTTVYDSELSDDYAGIAIVCLDWFHSSADSLAKVKYKQQLASLIAPNTKGASQTYQLQVACVGWPVPIVNPPRFMNIRNTVPILMINSVHDPECSLVWAHSLMEQIQNVVLLTRNGNGHTSYFQQGETARAIDAYLINGTLPAQDAVLDTWSS